MRIAQPVILLFLTLGISFAQAQQAAPNVLNTGQRDSDAIIAVQKSLEALGGVERIAAVKSVESKGIIHNSGSQQQLSFDWKVAVYGSAFEFRNEINYGSTTRVFVSGHGKPGYGESGKKGKSLSEHVALAEAPFDLPAIVLYAELQDSSYAFRYFSSKVGGKTDNYVEITNSSDDMTKAVVKQDWYFDQQTALPLRVEYNLPNTSNALDSIRASCVYLNYIYESGVKYPNSIQSFEHGAEVSRVSISSIMPNTPFSDSDFDMPFTTATKLGVQ